MLKKKNIILITAAAAAGLALAVVLYFVITARPDLSKPFEELNNVDLNLSFEALGLSEASWVSLVPDDLAGIRGNPVINVSANVLPDEDFNVQIPVIEIKPPDVNVANIAPVVSERCLPFKDLSSCSLADAKDQSLCNKCKNK